jgi:hypothetical protein
MKSQIDIAEIASTIGTENMLMSYDTAAQFIAPPDGPASLYQNEIKAIREQISRIALDVSESSGVESGESRKLRFQTLNAALVAFSTRMEDWERRVWFLVGEWLRISTDRVEISWPKDYAVSDLAMEVEAAQAIKDLGAPDELNRALMKNIAGLALRDSDPLELERVLEAIDTQRQERPPEPGLEDDPDSSEGN